MNSQIIIVLIIFFGLVVTIIFLFSKALIRKKNPINNNEIKNTSNLINCPDCKKEVSRDAFSCVNCGAVMMVRPAKKTIIFLTKWFCILFAVVFVVNLFV